MKESTVDSDHIKSENVTLDHLIQYAREYVLGKCIQMSANSDFGVAQDFLGQEEGDVKLYYVGAL